MAKIADLMRVSAKADILDDLPTNAFVLWGTVLEKAGDRAKPAQIDGIPGVEWRGSLTSVINELWEDLPKGDEARSRLGGYLAETLNMRCLIPRGKPPLWWVRAEFNSAGIEDRGRGYVAARTNGRKSRSIEEPPPAPVETAWQCPDCGHRADTKADLDQHRPCNRPTNTVSWLSAYLAEKGVSQSKDVIAAAAEVGISDASLYRARNKLGIKSTRKGFGAAARSYWSPPEAIPEAASTPVLDAAAEQAVQALTAVLDRNRLLEQQNTDLRARLDQIQAAFGGTT